MEKKIIFDRIPAAREDVLLEKDKRTKKQKVDPI